MIDECVCAARVTAQNIQFTLIRLYQVYHTTLLYIIFDYLRAVVYNSTVPTRWRIRSVQNDIRHRCRNGIKKKQTVTNVLLPIEIHVALFGLQATHKLPQSSHPPQTSTIYRCSNAVFKITNSNKGTAADRDKCDTVWASGNAQTHNLAPAELQSRWCWGDGDFCLQQHNLSIQ